MKSLDTNILVYAANHGCAEHEQAKEIAESLMNDPASWIIADQVLFEYYRILRSPSILEKPLIAAEAARHIAFLREDVGCMHCAYALDLWEAAKPLLSMQTLRGTRVFDAILAVTLQANGVRTFYTRNTSDFERLGLFEVINPID